MGSCVIVTKFRFHNVEFLEQLNNYQFFTIKLISYVRLIHTKFMPI